MATRMIEVLDPTAQPEGQPMKIAPRLGTLDGKVIGFVDNGKPNFDILLGRFEELLNQRFKLAGTAHVRKVGMGPASPLSPEEIKAVAGCDAIINGMCD